MGCTMGSPGCPSTGHRTSCNIVGCEDKNFARINPAAPQADRNQLDSLASTRVQSLDTVFMANHEEVSDEGYRRSLASPPSKFKKFDAERSVTTMNRLLPVRSHTNDVKASERPAVAKNDSTKQTSPTLLPSIWSPSADVIDPMTIAESGDASSSSSKVAFLMNRRVQSPHVQKIRMRHVERQHSDDGCRHVTRFPSIRASKLRKSASCNDSWLAEIDRELGLDEIDHLPAITEVETDGADQPSKTGTQARLSAFNDHQGTTAPWMTPNSSTSKLKRLGTRLLDSSDSSSRLPIILEDLDNPASTSSTQTELPPSSLYDPMPVGLLDEDADTEYSVRMYVASVTELIELEDIDPRDLPLLRNISIDPNSPLLVKYVQSQNNEANSTQEAHNGRNHVTNDGRRSINVRHVSNDNNNNNNNNNNDDDTSHESKVLTTVLVEQNGVG